MTTLPRTRSKVQLTLLKRAKLASIFAYPFLAVISVPSMMSLEICFSKDYLYTRLKKNLKKVQFSGEAALFASKAKINVFLKKSY